MSDSPKVQYLRVLRRLDRDWQEVSDRLQGVRALVDSRPAERAADTDLSELEAAEAAARERYEAHAAQEPELSTEFADRSELARANMDARRAEQALAMLLTAPDIIPDPAPGAAALLAAQAARAVVAALHGQANALDAEYQAACVAGAAFERVTLLEAKATALRTKIADAETRLAAAERRHRTATDRFEASEAKARRRVADIELLRIELDRTRAYAAELRARLPATVSAPLKEPRVRRPKSPAPPELHAVIRERYSYEPATDTLHRLPHGDPVEAPQSVRVAGYRIPRAAVIAVLAPPAFNSEDLA